MKKEAGKNLINRQISIMGARLHNLKNVSVDIPRNRFTVITGVSGSGKSSLAFDTLYAEGQRRFVESLSSYARQFLERMGKPELDSITGLPPAIAIEQNSPQKNPRSTVGTTTEIYDYLRLLFARIGTTICKKCGKPVKKDSPAVAVQELKNWDDGDKCYVMFQTNPAKNSFKDELQRFVELGFYRIVVGDSTDIIDLNADKKPRGLNDSNTFFIADRIVLRKDEDSISRLTDSVETAFSIGEGRITVRNLTKGIDKRFSTLYECADCEIVYGEPEPRLFSFNNPQGACPHCQGFGRTIGIDEELVVPDGTLSISKGALHPFRTQGYAQHQRYLMRFAAKNKIDLEAPWKTLSADEKALVWKGGGDYVGVDGFFAQLEEKNYKIQNRIMLSRYRGFTTCKFCGGSRLRTSARQVFIDDMNLPGLVAMSLEDMYKFIQNLKMDEYREAVAGQLLIEIRSRLGMLVDIGLGYLNLSRTSHTLSGGESQRINLATALGSALVGTLYVLDEPSIGMHPRDTFRLLNILYRLRNIGNTIVVVEHDPDIIRQADMIIDMGPNAGELGGEVMFAGAPKDMIEAKKSLTSLYLTGQKKIDIKSEKRKIGNKKITIYDASENNLKIDKVDFPLECLTVVTGVSGSGKSTLVHNILYAGLRKMSGNSTVDVGAFSKITGNQNVDFIEMVDQSSIGKSSRSTPVSYTKIFDAIRDLYASMPISRQMGWKAGHFSFNVPGGRCEACEGDGFVTVDMQFLPDVQLECEACKGTRYKKEVLEVLYKNKSIVDVLNMTVDEAIKFFESVPRISKKLMILHEVGLGYLRLGQPSTMLSGGEAQRIKLATHLEAGESGKTLFIFDEPTTGLHLDDISKLLQALQRLVDNGHSVVIIEHNLPVIASADWIIDLGPEAGEGGGRIVVEGPPEKIMKSKTSYTAKALREFMETAEYI